MHRARFAVLAVFPLVAGCTHPAAPPPSISLMGKTCEAAPNIGTPHRVALAMDKAASVTFYDSTDCLAIGPDMAAYAVFALPSNPEPYLVSVDSAPLGEALFAPKLQLLDANGKIVRDIPRDAFSFHGTHLYAGFRSHVGEAYLVVASDTQMVGQQISKVMDMTAVTTAVAGPVAVAVHTGSSTTPTFIYTLNGTVTVLARPMPKTN